MKGLEPARAVQDDSGHWYVIPDKLADDFSRDLQDEEMCDSGEFDEKYSGYLTGGDLNLVQLYAKFD